MIRRMLDGEIPSLHAAALILAGAALASRLLGLLRDRLLAARFGAGDTLDVYYAAFQIPDLLYTILLVGAASAAVMPVFMEYDRRHNQAAEAFVSNLLTVFSVLGLGIVGMVIALSPWLVGFVAPGFGPEKLALTVTLTRLMAANAVLLGIAGILSSVLQARKRFLVFALPPIFYNLGIIAGILWFVPFWGPAGLAAGVLAGGAMQVLVQVPAFRAMRFSFRPRFSIGEPGIIAVIRTSIPRVAALSLGQVTLLILAAILSFFAAGSLSAFKLAANLLYVPVGLFGVSYALAAFPKLSGAILEGSGEGFRAQLEAGIRDILFWALPFTALMVVLRAHIVRVVLGSGAFGWEDTRLVAATLAVLAVAVASECLLPLVLRAFYALGKTREPLFWDIAGSLATIGAALGFAFWFSMRPETLSAVAGALRIGDLPSPKILAVALAFAAGSLLNAALLFLALRRAARERLAIRLSFGWRPIAAMTGAAFAAGLAAYGALQPFPELIATNTFAGIALQGFVAGVVGLLVYGAVLWWQGNAEVRAIAASIHRRLLSPLRTPEVFDAEKLDGEGAK